MDNLNKKHPLREWMHGVLDFAASSYMDSGKQGFWMPTRRLDDGRWVLRWHYDAPAVADV